MRPIRTILCPIDFSEHSRQAFRVACMIARDQGARVIALHVTPPTGPVTIEGIPVASVGRPAGFLEQLWQDLQQFREPEGKVAVQHHLAEGADAWAIVQIARETDAEMIVMGTQGRTGLDRLLLGSVATEVMSTAPCPVVTVRVAVGETFPEVTACGRG